MPHIAEVRAGAPREHAAGDIDVLEALAAVDGDALVHPCLAYDRPLFGEWAYHALGVCWHQLGDRGAATQWFAAAGRARSERSA